ncbi:MAG: cytidine deaminase [Solirubrobacteraceae bacterium]
MSGSVVDLPPEDRALVERAVRTLEQSYVEGRSEVAAAMRMRSGAIYDGVHVEGSSGRMSVCAEGVALGTAMRHGDREIDTVAAVLRTADGGWRVVTPCGACRELIGDYGPHAHVVDYADGEVHRVTIQELIPGKTLRRWATGA